MGQILLDNTITHGLLNQADANCMCDGYLALAQCYSNKEQAILLRAVVYLSRALDSTSYLQMSHPIWDRTKGAFLVDVYHACYLHRLKTTTKFATDVSSTIFTVRQMHCRLARN